MRLCSASQALWILIYCVLRLSDSLSTHNFQIRRNPFNTTSQINRWEQPAAATLPSNETPPPIRVLPRGNHRHNHHARSFKGGSSGLSTPNSSSDSSINPTTNEIHHDQNEGKSVGEEDDRKVLTSNKNDINNENKLIKPHILSNGERNKSRFNRSNTGNHDRVQNKRTWSSAANDTYYTAKALWNWSFILWNTGSSIPMKSIDIFSLRSNTSIHRITNRIDPGVPNHPAVARSSRIRRKKRTKRLRKVSAHVKYARASSKSHNSAASANESATLELERLQQEISVLRTARSLQVQVIAGLVERMRELENKGKSMDNSISSGFINAKYIDDCDHSSIITEVAAKDDSCIDIALRERDYVQCSTHALQRSAEALDILKFLSFTREVEIEEEHKLQQQQQQQQLEQQQQQQQHRQRQEDLIVNSAVFAQLWLSRHIPEVLTTSCTTSDLKYADSQITSSVSPSALISEPVALSYSSDNFCSCHSVENDTNVKLAALEKKLSLFSQENAALRGELNIATTLLCKLRGQPFSEINDKTLTPRATAVAPRTAADNDAIFRPNIRAAIISDKRSMDMGRVENPLWRGIVAVLSFCRRLMQCLTFY